MTDAVIRVENLGKKYRLGEPVGYRTLRETITHAATAPLRWLKHNGAKGNNSTPDDIWALKDVSFEVKRGEVVGIIGRNGAGKSTLLKILSRITEPSEGHAEIEGRVGSLLEVGTGFHPELTGRENIYLNGAILGMSKADIARKFDEIVAFAEMERFLETPVKRYSSGMYMRLAFAVAAHLEPDVLVVDEVLAVGDAEFQKRCLGKMEDVARGGRTVLFVSHNMSAVETLCDRVVRLEKGTIAGIGSAAQEIPKYLYDPATTKTISLMDRQLEITRLRFDPDPVVSGGALAFELELSATKSMKITELALLFFSSTGQRLAILDLRKPDGAFREIGPTLPRIVVRGSISSFPFLEGCYSVGLYVRVDEPGRIALRGENALDLTRVTVRPNFGDDNRLVPYEAAHRGIVNLDVHWSDVV